MCCQCAASEVGDVPPAKWEMSCLCAASEVGDVLPAGWEMCCQRIGRCAASQ
eukprot:gene6820-biopygen3011